MALGEKISELRKQRKLSQEELANAMSVSRQAVSKWENGLSNPDTDNLIRLAEILDVDVQVLLNSREGDTKEAATENTQDNRIVKSKKTINVLCVLLILMACTTLLFFTLWMNAIRTQPNNEPTETVALDETEMWQNSLKMCKGLMREEVDLTSSEKKEIIAYISAFHFSEKTEENKQDGDYLYGGRLYRLEYERDCVLYEWYFTEQGFYYSVTLPEGEKMTYQYISDYTLLYELDRYID